tara:strand:- start:4588 stop:5247 length:660 start_codon:yes stop_codon:yes gene_type:complete
MLVTISIDDIHPEKGWGVEGDECMHYLDELNKEFGAKFTLFIPSNYHHSAKLSENKDWIDWLKSKGYFELAAHGHYHQCEREGIGECEFFELDTQEKAEERINKCITEWNAVNYRPLGWRNPGWLAHPEAVKVLGETFKYAAIHYEHNHNLAWKCNTLFGHDGINETEISLHNNNMIMFQSHIAGDWNDNVWNEANYNQMRLSLEAIKEVKYKTLSECL